MDQALAPDFIRRRQRIRIALGILLLAAIVAACWGINRLLRDRKSVV